jgi:hypothetical protein
MPFALVILVGFHPGRVLTGPRGDFLKENRARKEEKRAIKAAKTQSKDQKKTEKLLAIVKRREEKRARRF